MAYCTSNEVANLCRHLLGNEVGFNTSSSPTLSAVQEWMSSGCAILETALSSRGYSVPVLRSSGIFDWMSTLNATYAAFQAHRSRISYAVNPGEMTRDMTLEQQFWSDLERMTGMNLVNIGVPMNGQAKGFIGGVSKASKQTYKDNSDRVKPRFHRGILQPTGISTPYVEDDE